MKFTAPPDALKKTTKCKHAFSCLKTGKCGDQPMCEVSYRDGNNVLFLKDSSFRSCDYRINFGGAQACTCPTHFAMRAES